MRIQLLSVFGASFFVLSDSATAQSPTEQFAAIQDCAAAIELGDMEAARTIAGEMLSWGRVAAMFQRQARECVVMALGDDAGMTFQSAQVELREEFVSDREVDESRNILFQLFNELSAIYGEMNAHLISESNYEACLNLAEMNPDSAFTNPTCISSFQRLGHPDLPRFAIFAVSASTLLTERLEVRQRELLESLTEAQVEQLCAGEFESLCSLVGVVGSP